MRSVIVSASIVLRAAAFAAGTFGWFWAWWIIALAIEGAAP